MIFAYHAIFDNNGILSEVVCRFADDGCIDEVNWTKTEWTWLEDASEKV